MGLAMALVAVITAWQILAVAEARKLAESAPEEALLWRPQDPRALGYLAERTFIDAAAGGRSVAQAGDDARAALRASPLEMRALRVLGWVADDAGDDRRALRLMSLAASRSQRDVSSHLWMFHNRLKARDYNAAFAHGDALMRHGGTLREAAVLMASTAGADDDAATALVRRLKTGPVWRGRFVRELAASQDPDVTLSILLAVKEAGSTIRPDEVSTLVGRLFREGRPQEAYLAWVLLLSPAGYDVLDSVYNGGFEGPGAGGPFDWTLLRGGADVSVAPGRSGRALFVQTEPSRTQVMARQMLVVPPGLYRLSVEARVQSMGDSGIEWAVSCPNETGGQIGRLAVPDSSDWVPVSTTFVVPMGCDIQRLELRGTGKGSAFARGAFDNVRIEPVG